MKFEYWMANHLPAAKILPLLEEGFHAEDLYGMSDEMLKSLAFLTTDELDRIRESRKNWNPDEKWMQFQESGMGFVTMEQENYPSALRRIFDPPYALYYYGRLPEEQKTRVAIVGARGRSAYGCETASLLGRLLGQAGVDVISGLALGIDADGQKGCLDGGGRTYAVLGCGADQVYPRSNRWLYDRIKENGGILSEFPPGTGPLKMNFPRRNRIISGLADKVVVIEAREKSGSLITADYALEQGKDVYALPGRITDALSRGTNALIRQGAEPLLDPETFVRELKPECKTDYLQMDFRKNLLEKEEIVVYSLIDFQPCGLGRLMEEVPFGLDRLIGILDELKRKGFIRESVPNYFVRTM